MAVVFPLFDDHSIGGNNCRVACMYKYNVVVNSFFSMCEQGRSLYNFCVFSLFQNKLNWVAYVQEMCH